ncbi:stemmadenine O-acetyltransferase-like [Aristolochia californica]|uniref:stemmadenine O-acetyltransferase-like n=1 Tax=Aristolochia californica TaxID=171875 RepID=UPI0035E0CA03
MASVQITSAETIQPSTSTPEHLRTLKLSMLDMHTPALYLPLILYYSSNSIGDNAHNASKTDQLKSSLSEALTRFFPLAGRMKDESSVDCHDQGVDFFEAEVSSQLSEYLSLPNIEEFLSQLLPCNFFNSKSGTEVLLAIQLNRFQCGGIAIGVCVYHLVADMVTMATFINCWATTARGANYVLCPTFNSASLFPAKPVEKFTPAITETISTKRFVFTESSIATLRAKSSTYSPVGRPTRVEALSALIWRSVIKATRKEGCSRGLVCQHAVNIRSRMDPPLPDHSFGNLFIVAATSGVVEKDLYQGCLEEQLREAFRQINDAHVRELQGPNGHSKISQSRRIVAEKFSNMDIEFCTFSSWSRFPFYELDFGWGKPVWVSAAPFLLRNVVILLDGRCGNGVEAWMNLEKEDMARLMKDEELLSFISNPVIV